MMYESGKIYENVGLAEFSTLKVGGEAKFFCAVKNTEELRRILSERMRRLPIFILGGGSNILMPDKGFSGLVIKMEMKGVSYEESGEKVLVRVSAGESWDAFVLDTVSRGFWGLENLSGIPGTVGGAPIQNIGAYGAEAGQTIESVKVLDCLTGKEKILSNKDCRFSYRGSIFKKQEGKNLAVTEVLFRLSKKPVPNILYKDLAAFFALQKMPPTLSDIRKAILSIRSKKFPDLSRVGTAGSFFKNPVISEEKFLELQKKYPELPFFKTHNSDLLPQSYKIPLAFILDKICGLKGYTKGAIELFQNQPLVLVNTGGATAEEIKNFSAEIKKIVKEKTDIDVEEEVVILK